MITPTIVYTSASGPAHVLSVWPNIPEVTTLPAIQIDHGHHRHAVIEFRPEDAAAICAAIMEAAAAATLKKVD